MYWRESQSQDLSEDWIQINQHLQKVCNTGEPKKGDEPTYKKIVLVETIAVLRECPINWTYGPRLIPSNPMVQLIREDSIKLTVYLSRLIIKQL